jgi:hypothetical protein
MEAEQLRRRLLRGRRLRERGREEERERGDAAHPAAGYRP